MLEYDMLARLARMHNKMSFAERQKRHKDQAWKLVQEKGGGSATVQTSAYPTYQSMTEAKAAAPSPYQPSSSSISWNQSGWWWSQSWESATPPWRSSDSWGQKKW